MYLWVRGTTTPESPLEGTLCGAHPNSTSLNL